MTTQNKIIIVLIVTIAAISLFWFMINNQNNKVEETCKTQCIYITSELILGTGFSSNPQYKEVDYWRFGEYPNYRKFETRDQCVEYCTIESKTK